MKRRAWGVAVLLCAAPSPALADDEACFRAAVEGQKLERSGKLLEARERFVACAQRSCEAAAVVDKCTGWLQGVEAALPSLSIAVKDAEGRDVIAQHAKIDDKDATAALVGRAIDVDPGPHHVVVEVGGATLVEDVIVLQGEKHRTIVFRAASAAPTASTVASPGLLGGAITSGALALISIGVFAGFGASGVSVRSQYGCETGCTSDHFQTVHQDFVIADAALGVAIGTAVLSTVLFVVRSNKTKRDAFVLPGHRLGFVF
jgi:hypothetical protein